MEVCGTFQCASDAMASSDKGMEVRIRGSAHGVVGCIVMGRWHMVGRQS